MTNRTNLPAIFSGVAPTMVRRHATRQGIVFEREATPERYGHGDRHRTPFYASVTDEGAIALRDFLLEIYPVARPAVGTATVKIEPDLSGFLEKIEEAKREVEEPLAAWERELLGIVEDEDGAPLPEIGSTVRLAPKTRGFTAPAGSLATVEEVDPSRWGGTPAISVRWHAATTQHDGFYTAEDFEPFEPDPVGDVVGTIAYVTGDEDEWDHEIPVGAAVKILKDDVAMDGSYKVQPVKTGGEEYVGANDLSLDSPHVQEIPDGTRVKILDNGSEHGLRHYMDEGTWATVIGWTDTSAEAASEYDETYQVQDGGGFVQSVVPASFQTRERYFAQMLQDEARRMADAYRFPRRFVTGIDPATRVDWRDPAVKTWGEIFQVPERPKRCVVCGMEGCALGPNR